MPITRLLLTQINAIGFCVLSMFAFSAVSLAQESVDLEIKFSPDSQTRVVCDFSHSGSVIIENEDEEKITSLPLDVDAKITFFQRATSQEQTIRFYESAAGKIKLEKVTTTPSLDDANRLIVARLRPTAGGLVEMAAMTGVLKQTELDLIQNPADPMTLPEVFSKSDVKEGDKWTPSNTALAKMLRVHEIEESNVKLLLKKLDDKSARVYLMGSLNARVDDVTTQMEISGIAVIDRKAKSLSSFKLGIRQTRALGQIAPGFEGKTKIDVRISDASAPQLSSSELAKISKNRMIRQRVKWESQAGKFTVNYEPRWKMIAAEEEAAVLRFIDQDELLTQCNIVQLPSRPADKPLTMDAYKSEVAKIVAADENAQLVSAARVSTAAGNPALRVVVAGEEDGLPVNWFYYHISSADGRQVTLVFTMAKSVAKRVTSIATQLVDEFEFQPMTEKVADANSAQPSENPSKTATQDR